MAAIPYEDYDRNVIERTSWRVYSALQMLNTVAGGPTAGEQIPLVAKLNAIHAGVAANAQSLAQIKAALGIGTD